MKGRGIDLISHETFIGGTQSNLTDCGPHVIRGAGVSPAIFLAFTRCKTAAGTPAPQLPVRNPW
jgi:hypothetical protein